MFLDCDTFIMNDIWPVLEGDFEFKARPGSAKLKDWNKLFDYHDEDYMDWMPNAGFMVFKNGCHRNISEKWKDYYLNIGDKSYTEGNKLHREQYALALSVSGLDTEQMDETEHLMEWKDELSTKAILYHKANISTTYRQEIKRFLRHTKNLDFVKAVKNMFRS